MKLFTWMQRRFHHTSLKDGLAKDEEFNKRNGDVLDGWKDGILTIGTLGLDPLKPFSQHSDYFVLEEEKEDVGSIDQQQQEHESFSVDADDDVNEDEPLILTRFEHNYGEITGLNCEITEINSGEFEVPRKEKAERITLAELFMEDSDKKKIEEFVEFNETNKIVKKQPKNGQSFANKFMPRFKEESRPIKKIQKMVKRMLKRKIHPDVEASKDGVGNEIIGDSLSLLPTQLAIATGKTI